MPSPMHVRVLGPLSVQDNKIAATPVAEPMWHLFASSHTAHLVLPGLINALIPCAQINE